MYRSSIIYICITIGVGLIIILSLNLCSESLNINNNGFHRIFYKSNTDLIRITSIDGDNLQCSGIYEDRLYFHTNQFGKLISLNLGLEDRRNKNFKMDKDYEHTYPFRILQFGDKVYIMSYGLPAIFSCSLQGPEHCAIYILQDRYNQAALIGDSTFVIRSYFSNIEGADYRVIKFDLKNQLQLKSDRIFEQRLEGGFYNDGQIGFDSVSGNIIYMTYYRNNLLIIDSNLTVTKKAKTIDTSFSSIIKVIKRRHTTDSLKWNFALGSPPKTINRSMSVYGGKVYINSNLKADNESMVIFKKNSVIDVYRCTDGEYMRSFYIPNHKGKTLTSFKVLNDKNIIAIYGNDVALYEYHLFI